LSKFTIIFVVVRGIFKYLVIAIMFYKFAVIPNKFAIMPH